MRADNDEEKKICYQHLNKIFYRVRELVPILYKDEFNKEEMNRFLQETDRMQFLMRKHCRRKYRIPDMCLRFEENRYPKDTRDIRYTVDIAMLVRATYMKIETEEICRLQEEYFSSYSHLSKRIHDDIIYGRKL